MTVRIFITENGETKEWSGVPEDDRERISKELNRQALTALGYESEKLMLTGSFRFREDSNQIINN